ncbi:Arf guanyl-nucleotide exchange factor [Tieghemostelium lacteum]|uniref:Arf guanyl-nucleotide exchange factor n=1 Tax=Tieghemostelium lacteum TaxID=361077 RepID=A0A151ZC06_TIELA|nr:Arf guanyl-nucleotide exchange factor [Tieghemostelium lacteum]|eukprot:KYQ91487.1 Arf guanyl-nucleotide exchange factor [Tieghemostelium lacteum]
MDDSVALMFNNTLQKISNLSSRKNLALRESCKIAQDAIRDSPLFTKNAKHEPKEYEILANKLFIPLQLACETKEPKIMTLALDCFDKLMAYGIVKSYVIDESKALEQKKLIESIVNCIGFYFNFQDDNVQLQIIRSLLTAVITPTCDVHDTCLMSSIKTCYNIYLVTVNKVNVTAAKNVLFQMVDFVLQRFETISQSKMTNSKLDAGQIEEINNQYQVNLSDVNLLFRAFCKLSTKDDNNQTGTVSQQNLGPDTQEMKSKMLSLELLSRILESPLPSLKLSEKFINHSIKRYLSISLLHNGTSLHLPVFKLTLTLFQSLIIHFKEHLKEEIGLFFSKILLAVLSSHNCQAKQKWLILPVLYEICKNPQTIVDIFVNYDCDPDRKDIFEKMVYELSRVAQGTITGEQRSSNSDDNKFKILGLECIVTIMKSLVDWSKELYSSINPTQSSLNTTNSPVKKLTKSHSRNSSTDSDQEEPNSSATPLEIAISKFNQHPKKGIDYLVKKNLLKETPEDLSAFLKSNSSKLDQKKIGEYFNHSSVFTFNVLYKYIESFQFQGKEIDEALLELLCNFQIINSENQIIDKIVEKFAEKYYNDNQLNLSPITSPNLSSPILTSQPQQNNNNNNNNNITNNSEISNAETIYLLSYTIIILSTDLHNPTTKSKISPEEWIKMNSKINDKKDLSKEYLLSIYNRILNSKSISPSSSSTKQSVTNSTNSTSTNITNNNINNNNGIEYEEKFMRFNRESDQISKQCQELIKAKLSKKSIFYKARNIEHVRPMFLLSWCYVLSTLSVVLDDSKDKKLISLCLEGFTYAIRVSSIFYLNVERSSFITSLSKFSLLDTIKEPTLKNIECVKTLLSIGLSESNYLSDSWSSVLKVIFILERLHLIDAQQSSSSSLFMSSSKQSANLTLSSSPPSSINNIIEQIQSVTLSPQKQQEHLQQMIQSSPTLSSQSASTQPNLPPMKGISSGNEQIPISIQKLLDEYPKEMVFDSLAIEKIFTNSVLLSDDSIVTFFKCLCEISEDEINHYQKNYSLIKLVECIEYNFKRIRLVFYNIWEIVVQHFIRMGLHPNNDISLHAIDSLRQLATKYLEKQELSHYNFQNEFLTPFESIIRNNPSPLIQEHTIRCISQLSLSKTLNIKSGWKTIFNVLRYGSEIQNQSIVELSFNSIDQIIQKHLNLLDDSRVFQDIVQCLVSFTNPKVSYSECSHRSLLLLEKLLKEKFLFNNNNNNQNNNNNILKESEIKLLLPIITGFSISTLHENEMVRNISIDLLFKSLRQYGNSFSQTTWSHVIQNILKVNLQVMDLQKKTIGTMEQNWIRKSLPVYLENLLDLFSRFHLVGFYRYFLDIVEPFLCFGSDMNFQAASFSYVQFVHQCYQDFNEDLWEALCNSIQKVIHQLLISKSKSHHLYNFSKTLSSLSPIQFNPSPDNLIEKEFQDNLERFENTEPLLSIYNWQTAIQFMQKISNLFVERYHHQELPQSFTIALIKTWHQVYLLSTRINSEMTFLSFFGEMNSQSFESNSLGYLLMLLVEIYLDDQYPLVQSLCEPILEKLSIGILQEYSVSQFSSAGTKVVKIICQIIQGYSRFTDVQFQKHLASIYPFIVDFTLNENSEIRQSILFILKRISKSLPEKSIIDIPPTLILDPPNTLNLQNKKLNLL